MRSFTLGIVGAVCVASIASAADLPVKAAPIMPVAPVYSWTGFYIGGDIGALWTRSDSRLDPLPQFQFFGIFPISGDLNNTAFVGGLHAGYNWQVSPSWVVGFEGDWSWTNAKASFQQPWTSITGQARPGTLLSMSMDMDWLATIRGRVGYLVTPTTLVYFTAGVAVADVGYSASSRNERGTYAASTSLSKTATGYVLGGGLEWALWSNWSVRAEYLYYHLDTSTNVVAQDTTGFASVPNVPLPSGFSWGETDLHTARVGASYKF